MYPLIIVILALLIVALYPVVRDFLRQRKKTLPNYVEGLQLLLDGEVERAKIKLKAAVEEDTGNVDAYVRLGNIFLDQGDFERALQIHESLALRRNLKREEELKVYRALVRDYLKTNRRVKAIPLLEEIVRADRSDLNSIENLLELYIENDSWEKAENLLKECGRIRSPRVARLYAQFGYAFGKVNPQKGIQWLEEALRINPKSGLAHIYLGDLQLAQGETEVAIKTWTKMLDIAPEKNRFVRERLERAYYELGRYEDVAQLYRRLLHRVPHDTSLAVALAEIYAKKEDLAAAIHLLEHSGKNQDAKIGIALAELYLRQGNLTEAKEHLDIAVRELTAGISDCCGCGKKLSQADFQCPECHTWQEDLD
ncbi:MAG: tetratricopeptide repeat protein [candidate division WOR-3 bacterium]